MKTVFIDCRDFRRVKQLPENTDGIFRSMGGSLVQVRSMGQYGTSLMLYTVERTLKESNVDYLVIG